MNFSNAVSVLGSPFSSLKGFIESLMSAMPTRIAPTSTARTSNKNSFTNMAAPPMVCYGQSLFRIRPVFVIQRQVIDCPLSIRLGLTKADTHHLFERFHSGLHLGFGFATFNGIGNALARHRRAHTSLEHRFKNIERTVNHTVQNFFQLDVIRLFPCHLPPPKSKRFFSVLPIIFPCLRSLST